jgi:hypothetical protein
VEQVRYTQSTRTASGRTGSATTGAGSTGDDGFSELVGKYMDKDKSPSAKPEKPAKAEKADAPARTNRTEGHEKRAERHQDRLERPEKADGSDRTAQARKTEKAAPPGKDGETDDSRDDTVNDAELPDGTPERLAAEPPPPPPEAPAPDLALAPDGEEPMANDGEPEPMPETDTDLLSLFTGKNPADGVEPQATGTPVPTAPVANGDQTKAADASTSLEPTTVAQGKTPSATLTPAPDADAVVETKTDDQASVPDEAAAAAESVLLGKDIPPTDGEAADAPAQPAGASASSHTGKTEADPRQGRSSDHEARQDDGRGQPPAEAPDAGKARDALARGTADAQPGTQTSAKTDDAAKGADFAETLKQTTAFQPATSGDGGITLQQMTGQTAATGAGGETAAGSAATRPHATHPAAEMVSVQLTRAASNKVEQLTINLRPVELGSVEIKLNFSQDGRVQAIVTAERQETLDLMQRDSRSLERALQDAGLQTDAGSLSFNLRNNNGGNARQFANYVQPTGRRDLGAFAGEVENMSFIATPTGRVGRDRVDIRI